jgi:hypothetical protein
MKLVKNNVILEEEKILHLHGRSFAESKLYMNKLYGTLDVHA